MSRKSSKPKKKHKFFLNPYLDCAFTKCPKCETKTRIRKFPLVIHIEPQQILFLNKKCKYCTNCDLIIVKKQELELLIVAGLNQPHSETLEDKYVVMGTIERKDWQAANKGSLSSQDVINQMYIFKAQWDFEVIPAGWYPNEEK